MCHFVVGLDLRNLCILRTLLVTQQVYLQNVVLENLHLVDDSQKGKAKSVLLKKHFAPEYKSVTAF
jgi:hypothetical protein